MAHARRRSRAPRSRRRLVLGQEALDKPIERRGRLPMCLFESSERTSTPRQPELTRSTRSARSSTRAFRSASSSPSIRSRRRIAWLKSPRISAMCRATGSTSSRRPSRTRAPPVPESLPRARPLLTRALRSALSSAPARHRCRRGADAPWRPQRCADVLARGRLHPSAPRLLSSSDGHLAPGLRAADGSHRPVPGRASRRVASPCVSEIEWPGRAPCFSELPEVLGEELVVVNDSRVVAGRLRLARASGGAVELLLVERLDDSGLWEALARPSRRLRVGERLGPVSSSSTSGTDAGSFGSRESQPATFRSPRTSTSGSATRTDTRRCTHEVPARQPHRRRGFISRTASFVASSMSA